MSDHESSYYEIALTNRQVLVAFVALLVLVLAVFLGGVWLGRGQQGPASEDLLATTEATEDRLSDLEELSFFDSSADGGETEELDKPDLGKLDPRPDTAPAQEVARPSQASPPPPVRQASPPPPRQSAPPPSRTQARPAPPPAASAEQFVVQVFSTGDEPQARKVLGQLTQAGYKAFLSPVKVSDQTMYRVRVGPFDQRNLAEKAGGEVNRKFKFDTWITAATN